MKKLLTITVLLFSVTSFGQNGKFKIYESTAKNYFKGNYMTLGESPIEFKYANDSIYVSNFTWMAIMPQLGKKTKYYQIDIPEVLSVSGNVDTLEIKSKDIKYIKVDGKTYEIKRTTELKEIVDNYGFKGFLPATNWSIDASYYTPKIKH